MENPTKEIISIIKDWAHRLIQIQRVPVEGAYLFGSVLKPDRFMPDRSDVDLLLILSRSLRTPLARANTAYKILQYKTQLEVELKTRLGPRASEKPIVSVLLLTRFECDNAIHKGRDPRFFETTKFRAVSPREEETRLGSAAAELFRLLYPGLIPTVQRAQDYRNRYLSVDAGGERPPGTADEWNNTVEALPKELCRAAAPLRYREQSKDDETEYDPVFGLDYIVELVKEWSNKDEAYGDLREWLIIRAGGRAPRKPLLPERQLLLWEILAHRAEVIMSQWETPRLDPTPVSLGVESERVFLETVARPSLQLGGRSIECKLLPMSLWTEDRRSNLYIDDPESEHKINLKMSALSLPANTLDSLVDEIKQALDDPVGGSSSESGQVNTLRDVHEKLTKEGSNAYPRVVALPRIETPGVVAGRPKILVVDLGQSRYGVALVEEKRLSLPTAIRLRSHNVLNSLAVRVAYVYETAGSYWVECHQRRAGTNATWKDSWDVGAAGYIDPTRHKDPLDERRISPWQAAAAEIAEELAIPRHQLPHRDHYFFFGMGRNDPTGQLDLLGYCLAVETPDPNRPLTARVQKYDRCRLEPESVARFVAQKRNWIPTAVLTLVLTLEAFGYPKSLIDEAFVRWIGDVVFEP